MRLYRIHITQPATIQFWFARDEDHAVGMFADRWVLHEGCRPGAFSVERIRKRYLQGQSHHHLRDAQRSGKSGFATYDLPDGWLIGSPDEVTE